MFIIIFQEGTEMRTKIETIAHNFTKNRYKIPKTDLKTKLLRIDSRIEQTRQLIVMTIVGLQKYLES